MEDRLFQTRLCTAQCSYGSIKDQYLNIPKDHGVYFQDSDHPLLNANDHQPDKHILQFGRCTSKANPKNMVGDVLSEVIPIFGLAKLLKKAMKCEGCKCSPKTITAWEQTNKKDHLDGVDGITSESKAMCFYGGIITINPPEENAEEGGEGDGGEGEASAPKSAMERMPASVAANIDANNNAAQNYASNMNTPMPAAATNSAGAVTNSAACSCYACGNSNLASGSADASGCIASFNAANGLGCDVPMADMILANDVLVSKEKSLSKKMGAMEMMFGAMGCSSTRCKSFDDLSYGSIALVGMEGRAGMMMFNTFSANADGQYMCIENDMSFASLQAENSIGNYEIMGLSKSTVQMDAGKKAGTLSGSKKQVAFSSITADKSVEGTVSAKKTADVTMSSKKTAEGTLTVQKSSDVTMSGKKHSGDVSLISKDRGGTDMLHAKGLDHLGNI